MLVFYCLISEALDCLPNSLDSVHFIFFFSLQNCAERVNRFFLLPGFFFSIIDFLLYEEDILVFEIFYALQR